MSRLFKSSIAKQYRALSICQLLEVFNSTSLDNEIKYLLLEILYEKTKDDNGATTTQESKNTLDLIANIDRKLLNNLHSSNHEDYLTVLDEHESNFLTRDVIVSTDKYHIKNIIGIVNAECVFGAGSVPGYTDGVKFLTRTRILTRR